VTHVLFLEYEVYYCIYSYQFNILRDKDLQSISLASS
jgi:hypothetical protein